MQRLLGVGHAQLGPQRNLTEEPPRPRLVAALLVLSRQVERPARRSKGIRGAAGEQVSQAQRREHARVPSPEPHPLRLLDGALQKGDGVADAPRLRVADTERGSDRRKPERELPGTAEIETPLEDRDRLLEIPLADVEDADAGVRGGESERVVDRLGDPNRVAADPDPVTELAELGETPHQTRPRMDRRELHEPVKL